MDLRAGAKLVSEDALYEVRKDNLGAFWKSRGGPVNNSHMGAERAQEKERVAWVGKAVINVDVAPCSLSLLEACYNELQSVELSW